MTLEHAVAPGPVLLFGGPYSNLAATQAMRRGAADLGLPAQNCICTGDVVAYCAQPMATVECIRGWGIPVVMGNCEESLGQGADDCGCGFDADSTCSTLAVDWYRYADRCIDATARAWMRGLPRQVRFRLGGRDCLVVHGSPSRINRFVFPSTPAHQKRAELDLAHADIVIGGHAGIPFGERIGDRAWLNAGVIGLPANDGTRDGWYLLLTPDDAGLTATWHRLVYDADAEAAAMRSLGLDTPYADALSSGLWPSQDVLPGAERLRRGQPLRLAPLRV
jgi:predicted phosphodiesterase